MRLATALVALCIALIAASLGTIAFLGLGVSPTAALATAVTSLAVLTLVHVLLTGKRPDAHPPLDERSHQSTDLARQVGDLARRVSAAEAATRELGERFRKTTEPLSTEMDVLGHLLKQLAESVAAHEAALQERTAGAGAPMPTAAASPRETLGDGRIEPSFMGAALRETARRFSHARTTKAAEQIRAALEANRLDLHLQPIVTLPQRKVRHYEVLTRLRTEEGDLLAPPDFLVAAESAGLMPMLDKLMLQRAVRVLRRLTARNRDVGLFCNLSATTIVHDEVFPELLEFASANRSLAPSLVLEFSQAALRAMGGVEHESLAQLAGFGCRFSLDHVTDLQLEPRQLAERSFRFVKVPAAVLLSKTPAPNADIHPSDLADLLRRYGIELVAEKVESEGVVVDLLDHGVRFGQGFLFSPPRPVRAEVFGSGVGPTADSELELGLGKIAEPELPRAARRREPDPASAGAAQPRTPSGLAKLARDMVRRA